MLNLGRLPDELLKRFACDDLVVPPGRYEHALREFERRYCCNLVTYRAGCLAAGGPEHLCSNAYSASLSAQALQRLKTLEDGLEGLILVAYERPWRFRTR